MERQGLAVRSSFIFLGVVFLSASPVRAELVFFADGRSMSVKAHRTDGASMVLALRNGGEIVCAASLVARVEPDEIPYPEDAPLEPPAAVAEGRHLDVPLRADPKLLADPRYDPLIRTVAARHGVDVSLVRALIQVESNYQPRARSPKGAKGLMQLMPATARQYGVSNAYDPASNIEAGIKHLKSLLDRFPLELALAAYNAGEAAVRRFQGVPPFSETRTYVDRILRLAGRA